VTTEDLGVAMFHGQLYCKTCGFEGPDFMWMWHFGMGLGVLLQDRDTLALRVVWIPDDEPFCRAERQTQGDRARTSAAYVDSVVAREIRPTERRVLEDEIRRWEFEDHGRTAVRCPGCREMLSWRGTGIS